MSELFYSLSTVNSMFRCLEFKQFKHLVTCNSGENNKKVPAFSSFQSYNYKRELDLTKNEPLALNNLSNNWKPCCSPCQR